MRWGLLKRRIHISWHIAWASIGVVFGAALIPLINISFNTGIDWLVLSCCLLLIALTKRLKFLACFSLAAGLLIGIYVGNTEQNGLRAYEPYYGHVVIMSGTVNEDTSYGTRGDQRLRLKNIRIGNKSLPATAWVSLDSKLDIKRGDTVEVEGRLEEGFGNIPASLFRANLIDVSRPVPGDVARRIRDWFADGIRQTIPEPQSSLGIGYLVGQRSTLPDLLSEQLRIVGLTHVVVASGYNLTILVSITRKLFARISKYLATLFASLMILGFMFVTGFSPSMSRAGLVSGLSLAAWYYGRNVHPLVLLPFSAAITVIINPAYAWGDIGWYLSFTAFSGVIILAPLLHHYFWGNHKKPGVIREIIVGTMAAQLATMPIIMYAFGQYSAYALPANILVLPLIPLTMLVTFIGGLAALFLPILSPWVGAPANFILSYMILVVEWIASLPGSRSEISIGLIELIAGYIILILLGLFLWGNTSHKFRSDDSL